MLYDLTLSVALEEGETLPEAMDLLEFADYALNWVASGPINIVEVTATPANGEGVALTAHVEIRQGLGRKLLMLFTGQMDDWEPANILSGTLTLHDASSGEDVLPRYLFPAKRRPPLRSAMSCTAAPLRPASSPCGWTRASSPCWRMPARPCWSVWTICRRAKRSPSACSNVPCRSRRRSTAPPRTTLWKRSASTATGSSAKCSNCPARSLSPPRGRPAHHVAHRQRSAQLSLQVRAEHRRKRHPWRRLRERGRRVRLRRPRRGGRDRRPLRLSGRLFERQLSLFRRP